MDLIPEIPKARCGPECVCHRCNGIGRVTDEPTGQAITEANQHQPTKLCPRCGGNGKLCQGHKTTLRKPEEKPVTPAV